MKRYSVIPTDKRILNKTIPIIGILKSNVGNESTAYVMCREDIACTVALMVRTLHNILSVISHDNTQYRWANSDYIRLADVPLDTQCIILNKVYFEEELIVDE